MTLPVIASDRLSAAQQLDVLHAVVPAGAFATQAEAALGAPLRAGAARTLQINVGKKCNQTCKHCHVDAGPDRTEMMDDATVDAVLALVEHGGFSTLDITGGAPELHARFEELVVAARARGLTVMDRCNLTILNTRPYAHLPQFFADQGVHVVASLPFPYAEDTDRQRGDGVYEGSIRALRALNGVGYGMPGAGLRLSLVANPTGAFLPAPQASLEADFKRLLAAQHDVHFSDLFALTNLPISRYLEWLESRGKTAAYLARLKNAFNPAAAAGVMCIDTLSVGWDGALFDCDFNQMLELPLAVSVADIARDPRGIPAALAALAGRPIRTAAHCYGCTAGQGSSCGGATA